MHKVGQSASNERVSLVLLLLPLLPPAMNYMRFVLAAVLCTSVLVATARELAKANNKVRRTMPIQCSKSTNLKSPIFPWHSSGNRSCSRSRNISRGCKIQSKWRLRLCPAQHFFAPFHFFQAWRKICCQLFHTQPQSLSIFTTFARTASNCNIGGGSNCNIGNSNIIGNGPPWHARKKCNGLKWKKQ